MAVWQYQFRIIAEKVNDFEKVYDPDQYEDTFSLENHQIDKVLLDELSSLLPEKKGWSEDMSIYGDEETTAIEFFYDEEKLVEILVRFDLREFPRDLFFNVMDILNRNGLLLWEIETDKVLEPDAQKVRSSIVASSAYRFVKNPKKFFEELGEVE